MRANQIAMNHQGFRNGCVKKYYNYFVLYRFTVLTILNAKWPYCYTHLFKKNINELTLHKWDMHRHKLNRFLFCFVFFFSTTEPSIQILHDICTQFLFYLCSTQYIWTIKVVNSWLLYLTQYGLSYWRKCTMSIANW